jgi:hypothetical protein
LITATGGAAHDVFATIRRLGFVAELARLEQRFDFLFGEGFDRRLLELGDGDGLDRIGQLELTIGPSEESTKTDVEVVDGFRGEGLRVAGNATGFVVGAQPDEVVLQQRRRDLLERYVARVFQPQLKITLIALQGIGTKSFSGFVL